MAGLPYGGPATCGTRKTGTSCNPEEPSHHIAERTCISPSFSRKRESRGRGGGQSPRRTGVDARERSGATMNQGTIRKTFDLPGLSPAGRASPDLVQVGDLFFTSGVRGVDL